MGCALFADLPDRFVNLIIEATLGAAFESDFALCLRHWPPIELSRSLALRQ
jgi:hypothetical protein